MSAEEKLLLHQSHRERMRERAIQYGFDSFADHEMLEMFLYSVRARGDTNELAHRLIEHFGSFGAVMEAGADELKEVPGIGPQAAFQISLSMEMMRRCARSRQIQPPVYDTVQKIALYMWSYLIGQSAERLYVMMFDNRMSLITHLMLSEGTVNNTGVPKRELLELVLRKKASHVVLAHNHPHGSPQPSLEDIQLTNELADLLGSIGVLLREHLIITDMQFRSIMKEHCRFPQVCSGIEGCVGNYGFDWNAFYDVDEETYTFPLPVQ